MLLTIGRRRRHHPVLCILCLRHSELPTCLRECVCVVCAVLGCPAVVPALFACLDCLDGRGSGRGTGHWAGSRREAGRQQTQAAERRHGGGKARRMGMPVEGGRGPLRTTVHSHSP
jgi:hypothetical protein